MPDLVPPASHLPRSDGQADHGLRRRESLHINTSALTSRWESRWPEYLRLIMPEVTRIQPSQALDRDQDASIDTVIREACAP